MTTQSPWAQRRYLLIVLAFFGFFTTNSMRVILSVATVAMTSDRFVVSENGTTINVGPEFSWDNRIQGYLLGSFSYGYAITHILGGYLGKKFGGKLIFGGSVGVAALVTIICPWLANLSVYAFMTLTAIIGAFDGMSSPSLFALYSKWLPPQERSRRASQALSGSFFGTVFYMIFFGYLADTAGWKSLFWFSGGLNLVWVAAWMYFIHETPEEDLNISKEELEYIQTSLRDMKSTTRDKTQWKALFSSPAVWAFNVAFFCEIWGSGTLNRLLPKYFKEIYQFELSKSGILSALPYLAMALMMQVSGHIMDRIAIKKWLTLTQTRKLFVILGFISQTAFILGAAFWGNVGGTVFCLVMAVGLGALAMTTLSVNVLDIAPLHAGIVYGQGSTLGTTPSIVSPIIAGYVISTENPTIQQWRIVFYITATLYFFGATIYGLFGSASRQPWDMNDTDKEEAKNHEDPKEKTLTCLH